MSGVGAYAVLVAILAMAVYVVVINRNNVDHVACVRPTAMPATWFGACR